MWIKPNATTPSKLIKKRESSATLTLKRVSGLSGLSGLSSLDSASPPTSQTQWYDSKSDGPIIELSEQVSSYTLLLFFALYCYLEKMLMEKLIFILNLSWCVTCKTSGFLRIM